MLTGNGFTKRGQPPALDHTLHTPFVEGKPDGDPKEGLLLASIANWQRAFAVAALIALGAVAGAWRLSGRVAQQVVPHIVEVAETGGVRSVGILPQTPYVPSQHTIVDVLTLWLDWVRTVGDSRIMLGQHWHKALAFTAPEARSWLTEYLTTDRQKHWAEQHVIQITIQSVLPIAQHEHSYKVAWEEVTYNIAGDVHDKRRWEATILVTLRPPEPIDLATWKKDPTRWLNGVGIYIKEAHWLAL